MTDLRIFFEHLMCDAFHCGRAGYYFANADYFDAAHHHPEEALAFLLCALIIIKEYKGSGQEVLDDCIKQINDAEVQGKNAYTLLVSVLQKLVEAKVVY